MTFQVLKRAGSKARSYTMGFLAAVTQLTAAQSQTMELSLTRDLRAEAVVITGRVTYLRDGQPWAVSAGELIPLQKTIITGSDGSGHFRVTGGDTFDVFANSQVVFRQNTANPGDLLDVLSGRVRIHLAARTREQQQRIFSPYAIMSTHGAATLAVAVDEEAAVRIDVTEGEIRVQHTLLPRSEPVLVKAIDAILVRKNEPVSRQVDRGSLYRYTVKVWSALTFGHSGHDAEPIEANKLFAPGKATQLFRFNADWCP